MFGNQDFTVAAIQELTIGHSLYDHEDKLYYFAAGAAMMSLTRVYGMWSVFEVEDDRPEVHEYFAKVEAFVDGYQERLYPLIQDMYADAVLGPIRLSQPYKDFVDEAMAIVDSSIQYELSIQIFAGMESEDDDEGGEIC